LGVFEHDRLARFTPCDDISHDPLDYGAPDAKTAKTG